MCIQLKIGLNHSFFPFNLANMNTVEMVIVVSLLKLLRFSRYWLFEPRCYMHDTGGWYIETFGRDKKGRTIPSPRQWDGFSEYSER
jgi:hypothetical protein